MKFVTKQLTANNLAVRCHDNILKKNKMNFTNVIIT